MSDNNKFYLKDSNKYIGKEVTVKGWVFNIRSSGSIVFLHLRDGSGFIQATVIKGELTVKDFTEVQKITLETAVEVKGLLREEKRAPGGYEITVKKVQIISLAQEEYPIGKKEHGPDFLLTHRHLWLRSRRQWAILQIRNEVIKSINEFLLKDNFIRIDSPMITPSACEGTTTLFEIDYFGEKAFLSQSGQLYLEAAIYSVGRCYDFNPVLRAEKSKTRRHLIEFWMMDAEAAFVDFGEILEIQEELILYILNHVINNCRNKLKLLERNSEILTMIKSPFPRITYKEAIKQLQKLGSDIKYGTDLGNDDETCLMNHYKQPIFVTHFPAEIKAFYCKKDEVDNSLALSADLLAPEGYGEITGGGQREEDYQLLLKNIKKHKYDIADYEWYLDLRKYGSVPHSGFGLGLERLVAWICKLDHVRETIPFPRMLERFRP
ncbi:asparagine--tRNA ligase [Candidatus Gottesmanbacteria bacterium RIFCSPLOWO2_01_FULL_39_12b]|uniref:Asparagine--tRNA ligase n=1 Tax=Candidatus Gottesmanbacteria bacterium RIFCSPLOWO2_01_FULL_39_12b TaxID=1798388 RepID=A0A1F6AQ42_9BACT|nr:MAG: asparagine--tRNA ligase [Candidatus Gottesmanbacteria bacterium RIFCSPLOWO2_01_FULL_39_12b]